MGTFRVTFATSTTMRFACVAAGFRYGSDSERAKTIEAVLEENIPDLVVLTSGAFLNFKPESIPEGAHLSSMNVHSWCERLPDDFVKHTFPIIDPSLNPSFLPWNLVGVPLVGLRSYVHNGQLKKVTWARGVPAMEPTFLTPHRKIIDCGSGEIKEVSNPQRPRLSSLTHTAPRSIQRRASREWSSPTMVPLSLC